MVGGTLHTGAQTVALERRLRTYPSGRMAWRRLWYSSEQRRPTNEEQNRFGRAFVTFIETFHGVMPKYNMNLIDFFEYGTRTDNDDNNGKFVCTSWAASILQAMGVLRKQTRGRHKMIRPGNVLLVDFGTCTAQPPMQEPWRYGEVLFIEPRSEKKD